jgi:hypothetical protein
VKILQKGAAFQKTLPQLAHYWKYAADQNYVQAQVMYANCLLRGDGVKRNVAESERYFQLACSQGDSCAQMRYGIVLLSGLLGRFDFRKAETLFAEASSSNRFARVLRIALLESNDRLFTANEYSDRGSIFAFLRLKSDDQLFVIRLLNAHWRESSHGSDRVLEVWKDIAMSSIHYLLDVSETESAALATLPTDLFDCESIPEMMRRIFRMYTITSSLYKNVNYFLRSFPIKVLGKFMKELKGLLSYIYLLQSSVDYCAYHWPLVRDITVFRGVSSDGCKLADMFESMIDKFVVLPSFTSTSIDRQIAIRNFVGTGDGILFEITLHPGDIATPIEDHSMYGYESEILIAASSVFRVIDVDQVECTSDSPAHVIPRVRLNYEMSWSELDIDKLPPPLLV